MTQWDKLLEKLTSCSSEIRYQDLEHILFYFGYTKKETNSGSSHVTFRKAGHYPITIPRHSPIKKAYIKLGRDAVEEKKP